jgi:hypothetical protein
MKRKIVIGLWVLIPVLIFGQEYQVGDHELLFMPTAYTMEKGSSYFSDYELFFLNFAYAPTSSTHLGIFTLFPIAEGFLDFLTLGAKQNLLRSETLADAAWITYTPKGSALTIGDVLSIGRANHGLHLAISLVTDLNAEDAEWYAVYMAGYRYDLSKKLSLMVEYMNSQAAIDEAEFNGMFSIGFRFHSESVAWEVGGFRPLEETEGFYLFPMLKGTFLF